MTQCTLGTEPKDDAPMGLWITWAALISWASSAFIVRFVPSIVDWFPDEFQLLTVFCATEPEEVSEPDLFTWLAALRRDPVGLAAISYYLGQKFRSYLWPTYCQCVAPVETNEYCTSKGPVTPNYPTGVTNGVCALGTNCGYLDANLFGDGATPRTVLFPTGQHKTRITLTPNFSGTIEAYTATSGETYLGTLTNGVQSVFEHSWPTGDPQLQITWRNGTGTGGGGATLKVEFMNAAGEAACTPLVAGDEYEPTGVEVPPEIPDIPTVSLCDSFEDVCAQINLIRLQIDAQARVTTTAISPSAPANWLPGVASTGLTGHGTLSVSGIVGVIVECAVPSWWADYWTTPKFKKPSIGMIQFGVAGIETDANWINFEQQLVLGAPGLTDHVVWNFRSGVTGSITPLYRASVGAP